MLTRRKIVAIGIESSAKGTAATPSLQVLGYDVSSKKNDTPQDRKPSGLYAGHTAVSRHAGTGEAQIMFKTELRGNGSGDWDPACSAILKAAGLKLTTKTFTPVTPIADQTTLTAQIYEDGRIKKIIGASAEIKIAPENDLIMLDVTLTGVWQDVTDVAMPSANYSTQPPIRYSLGSLTINSVKVYTSEFSFETGNTIAARLDCGAAEYYHVTDRSPKFTCDPEAVLAATNDMYGKRDDETPVSVSLVLTNGTDEVTLAGDHWQIIDISDGDRDGTLTDEIEGIFVTENVNSGDDEYSIVIAADA